MDLADGKIEDLLGERAADRKLARAMVAAMVRGEPLEDALTRVQEKAKLRVEMTADARAAYAERIEKIAKMVQASAKKKGGDTGSDES